MAKQASFITNLVIIYDNFKCVFMIQQTFTVNDSLYNCYLLLGGEEKMGSLEEFVYALNKEDRIRAIYLHFGGQSKYESYDNFKSIMGLDSMSNSILIEGYFLSLILLALCLGALILSKKYSLTKIKHLVYILPVILVVGWLTLYYFGFVGLNSDTIEYATVGWLWAIIINWLYSFFDNERSDSNSVKEKKPRSGEGISTFPRVVLKILSLNYYKENIQLSEGIRRILLILSLGVPTIIGLIYNKNEFGHFFEGKDEFIINFVVAYIFIHIILMLYHWVKKGFDAS